MPSNSEIPLDGGNLSVGVVRVGDTVRRPVKPSSELVARLLGELEARGVSWAPRYLGRDEQGRDTFTFIAGSVPTRWLAHSDAQVAGAARLLRALHDATRGSQLAGTCSVVCHNDPSPSNTVFDEAQQPVAFIDFDFAAPGEPLEDLGYLAWAWCVSSQPTRPALGVQAAQLRVAADAYGASAAERAGLVDAILERFTRNRSFWSEMLAQGGDARITPERMARRVEWSDTEFAFVTENRAIFEAALR